MVSMLDRVRFSGQVVMFAAAGAAPVAALVGWLWWTSPAPRLSARVTHIALDARGRMLAVATGRGGIVIHDLAGRRMVRELPAEPGRLNDISFSPDGAWLAIADRNLRLVPMSGAAAAVLRDDGANYGCARFSPDGRMLVTVSGRGAVITFDPSTGAAAARHCCTSIWGDAAFTEAGDGIVWAGHWPGLLPLRPGAALARLTASREFMAFGPLAIDGARIFAGSQDGRVYCWSAERRALLGKSPPLAGYVRSIVALGGSGWVAYAASDGPVHLWRPATGESRAIDAARTTSNLAYDAATGETLLGTASGSVEFWRIEAGRRTGTLAAH